MGRNKIPPGEAGSHVEWCPEDYCFPTRLGEVFGREAPVHVDAGCGDGLFLVEMARRHPECDFLGIERLLGRVRKTCRRAARAGVSNLRVLRLETAYAVRYLLPPESITVFHFSFPDPWPKRRHNDRRLFQTAFATAIQAALRPDGELRITTDHAEYFSQMLCTASGLFTQTAWPHTMDYPATDFERRFVALGTPIYRARFVNSSPVT